MIVVNNELELFANLEQKDNHHPMTSTTLKNTEALVGIVIIKCKKQGPCFQSYIQELEITGAAFVFLSTAAKWLVSQYTEEKKQSYNGLTNK